jgi:hypothetical protein
MDDSFLTLTQALSDQHRETFRALALSDAERVAQARLAVLSLEEQAALEAKETQSFADYRVAYLQQPLLPLTGAA